MTKNQKSKKTALDYAKLACDTMMRRFAPSELPPVGRFHYHQGVFLSGMEKTYELCQCDAYLQYVKAWVDSLIDPYGEITQFNPGQLDDLQPGILLFPLYEITGDARYKTAMDTIAYYIEHFPRCACGGFWHKAWYRQQMWLDGLYMAGPFAAQYGAAFGRPELFDIVTEQAQMMREKTRDSATGLWYHAWDERRLHPWANPETGRSPEFWGRSVGWVTVALLDDTRFIPKTHPGYQQLRDMARELILSVLPYQDEKTGLWYQVIDKGDRKENWLEISCSCLFTAAICRALREGVLDDSFEAAANKGYEGVIRSLTFENGDLLLSGVCVGTGVGDYKHYCERPTSTNDLHGVGAFLLMCAEAQAWKSMKRS